jgi:hypothetical protein
MANRKVKLKNKSGDYLYPYTDNIPTATTSKAGIVKLDSAPTANSNNAITSGAVNTAINTVNTNLSNKLGKSETAAKATADADGNNIANTYLKKTETAAKATADADGNNIATTYLKKGDEGKGGLNLLVNQLRKAYAWTWSQTSSSGMVYVIYNSNGDMLDGVACSSYASYGGYGGYVGINGNLYYYNTYSTPVTLTQKTSDGGITQVGYGNVIKNGKLYSFFKNDYTDNNTGWTKISGFFGLRNGALMTFTNQSTLLCSVLDNGGAWTDVATGYNDAAYCAGIRDGYPYYVSRTGVSGGFQKNEMIQFDTTNGYSMVSSASSNYFYFIKGSTYKCWNSAVYHNTGKTEPYYQGDLGEQITKVYNNYALTSGGKLYSMSSNKPSLIAEDVIDIGVWGYLKSDGLYNYSKTRIVEGTYQRAEGVMLYAGAGTTQYRTVYTVANPAVNYKSYERVNLDIPSNVTAASSTSITTNSKTYNRDISKDSVFTQTPDDLKKQTPTKWELLDMISNLE